MASKINRPYTYRGLPCNIKPDDKLWCVSGRDGNGGGVLEWCYDEADARTQCNIMSRFAQFSNLSYGRYVHQIASVGA